MTTQSLQNTADQAAQTQTPAAPEVDAFSAAFDDLTALAAPATPATPPAEPAPATPATPPADPALATPPADPAAVETAFTPVDPAPATPAAPAPATPAPATPPAEPAPVEDDLLKRFANLLKQAPVEAAPTPAPVEQEPAILPPPMSQDDLQLLAQYDADFPDVSKAETLKRRAETHVVVQHIFREFAKALSSRDEAIQMLLERTQLSDLKQAVPTYDSNLRNNVVEWVGKQPAYLQHAYNNVIQSGTVEEVADLIHRYEQATRKPAAAPAAQAAPKPATELPAATKQAVAALAPVGSKRSTVVQGIPQTFEDAFDAFAKNA